MIAALAAWVARVAVRHRLAVLVVTGLALAAAVRPALTVPFDASAEVWFLENDPARQAYERFHDLFGDDEFLVLTTEAPRGTVFQDSILASVERVTAMLDTARYAGRVTSLTRYEAIRGDGEDVFVEPALPPPPWTPQQLRAAERRILSDSLACGRVVTADGKIAVITAQVQHLPGRFRHKGALVRTVRSFLDRERREHGIRYAFTGSPVLDHDIYETTRRDRNWNVPLLYLLITLLLAFTVRNVPGTLLPLGVVFSAVILDRSLFAVLGWKENSLATMIPLVLTAVGIADSVHIVVQYFTLRGRGLGGPEAAEETVRRLFQACFLTSFTTAVGFLSLLVSPLAPLQQLGAITSLGVVLAFLLSVLALPAALSYLPGDYRAYAARRTATRLVRMLDALPAFVLRRRAAILAVAALVSLGTGLGLARLRVESNALSFFRKHDPMRTTAEYIQDRVGGVGNLEVIVGANGPEGIRDPRVLRGMETMERWLKARPLFTDAFSVVEYLKATNQAMHGGNPAFYRIPDTPDLVSQYLLLYESSSPARDLGDLVDLAQTRARVGARVKFAPSGEYKREIARLRQALPAMFPPGTDVKLTGLMVLYKNMGDYIVRSQIRSFLLALLVITITMAVSFRSWRLGLLSMVPNVWPIAFTLGVMGWLEIRLDMVSAMVAAIAIGIAVDDTVHFLSKFTEAARRGRSPFRAVRYAFHVSGRAIVYTTLILLAGFGVILRSGFLPSVIFAALAMLCMATALAADLLILPALFLKAPGKKNHARHPGAMRAASLVVALAVAGATAAAAGSVPAPPDTTTEAAASGRAVFRKLEDADADLRSEAASITMILRDRAGHQVTRKARMERLAANDGERSLLRFTDPPDLRGTAFLNHHRPGDDDQWLYLPALGRVKRISARRKASSFLGTQFTYEDLGGRDPDEYRYRRLRQDRQDGETVDVVEAIPRDKHSGYSRIVSWVSVERPVILRAEYFDRHGALLKVSRFLDYTRPDGRHWRFRRAIMENTQTGRSTEIVVEEWALGARLDAGDFTVEALKRGS